MTRKGLRVRVVDMRKPHFPSVECGSVRLAIEWLKNNGLKPVKETVISDYFRLHPDRCTYVPDNRQYAIIKLEEINGQSCVI